MVTEINLGNIKGPKGDKGDTGEKGDTGATGATGAKGEPGKPFTVTKTYSSISEMNLDFENPEIDEGDFVMIVSNVEDEDNAKLYTKGSSSFVFITDLSGAQGMKGDKGDTGATGETGATGAKGDKGDTGVGISSITKTNTSGLVDTYTITFDDESTTIFSVTNGEKGEKGDKGDPGDSGADGKTPSFRVDESGNLYVSFPD